MDRDADLSRRFTRTGPPGERVADPGTPPSGSAMGGGDADGDRRDAEARRRRRALRRARERWREHRPTWLLVATAVVCALGAWGFAEAPDESLDDLTPLDIAYRVPHLFLFSGGDIPGDVPLPLEIARFLAPAITGYAALAGLITLFREQATRVRVRLTAREHVLICGLGRLGFGLACGLYERGHRVVALESDAAGPWLQGCRERGIPVLIGDARDSRILRRGQAHRARDIVAACGTDGVNLDVLGAASRLAAAGGAARFAHVELGDYELWRELEAAALAADAVDGLRVDYFSVPEILARTLLEAGRARWATGEGVLRPLVVGDPPLLQRVCAQLARRAVFEGRPLELCVAATQPPATDVLEALGALTVASPAAARRPAAADGAEATPVRVWPALPSRLVAAGKPFPWPVDLAFVCIEDDGAALAEAVALAGSAPEATVHVLVANRTVEAQIAPLPGGDRIVLVDALRGTLAGDLLRNTTIELLARARHEQYLQDERAKRLAAINPSLVPWDDLPLSLKRANRRFAESMGAKLDDLGARLAPLGAGRAEAATPLDGWELDALAAAEHERWMRERAEEGWRRTDQPKDPRQLLHPSLVPWDELSESEREKDREVIRGLGRVLALAGYAIERPGAAHDGAARAIRLRQPATPPG